MCYTANDSLIAYTIGMFSSLYLTTKSSVSLKILGYFFMFVTQMQLFDFLFWKNTTCNLINLVATKLAILVNHLQPILLFGLLLYFNVSTTLLSKVILILYIILMIPFTISGFSINCTLPKNGIMYWAWNDLPNKYLVYGLFLLSLVSSGFNLPNTQLGVLFSTASLLSFIVSHKIPVLNQSVGRIWCYLASFAPIFFSLIPTQ